MKHTLLIASFTLLLAGCGDGNTAVDTVRTTDWYKENPAEMDATIKQCDSNPGQLAMTPNCINAAAAHSQNRKEALSKSLKTWK